MKAYCIFDDFNSEALLLLNSHGIMVDTPKGKGRPSHEELKELVKNYEILIIGAREKMDSEVYKSMTKLRVLCSLSVGLDHISSEFFTDDNIVVVNSTDSNIISVAEHSIALALAILKELHTGHESAISGLGRAGLPQMPVDLRGKTVGIIGAGRIATAVIERLRCFGVKVLCYTSTPSKHSDLNSLVEFVSLSDLLKESNIISIHVPLNATSKKMIGFKELELLKRNCILINTSRLDIINIDALVEFLTKRPDVTIAFDVDIDEDCKRIFSVMNNKSIITPHIAGISKDAMSLMDMEIASKLIRVLERKL